MGIGGITRKEGGRGTIISAVYGFMQELLRYLTNSWPFFMWTLNKALLNCMLKDRLEDFQKIPETCEFDKHVRSYLMICYSEYVWLAQISNKRLFRGLTMGYIDSISRVLCRYTTGAESYNLPIDNELIEGSGWACLALVTTKSLL